jgi:hypothetical protein
MHSRIALACALAAMLAGCGTQPTRPVSTLPPRNVPRYPAVPPPPPPAQVLRLPGLEQVIGADARALVAEFGAPQLDAREGDARKLQFAGPACVLDVYLYPPAAGGEPRATYVAARRASDGLDVDRAACVAALRQH